LRAAAARAFRRLLIQCAPDAASQFRSSYRAQPPDPIRR
jgi:hypothetical protein